MNIMTYFLASRSFFFLFGSGMARKIKHTISTILKMKHPKHKEASVPFFEGTWIQGNTISMLALLVVFVDEIAQSSGHVHFQLLF